MLRPSRRYRRGSSRCKSCRDGHGPARYPVKQVNRIARVGDASIVHRIFRVSRSGRVYFSRSYAAASEASRKSRVRRKTGGGQDVFGEVLVDWR